MTNLNEDTCELSLNELDAVTGGSAFSNAIDYAVAVGKFVAKAYAHDAHEVGTPYN